MQVSGRTRGDQKIGILSHDGFSKDYEKKAAGCETPAGIYPLRHTGKNGDYDVIPWESLPEMPLSMYMLVLLGQSTLSYIALEIEKSMLLLKERRGVDGTETEKK